MTSCSCPLSESVGHITSFNLQALPTFVGDDRLMMMMIHYWQYPDHFQLWKNVAKSLRTIPFISVRKKMFAVFFRNHCCINIVNLKHTILDNAAFEEVTVRPTVQDQLCLWRNMKIESESVNQGKSPNDSSVSLSLLVCLKLIYISDIFMTIFQVSIVH